MGIKNLQKLIDEVCPQAKTIQDPKSFFGRVVAIDASMVLYQMLIAITDENGAPLTNGDGRVTSHLQGLISRYAVKAQTQFDKYTPSDTEEVQRLIERARAFDPSHLTVCMGVVDTCVPLAKRVIEGKARVERFLKEHSSGKDCASVLPSLVTLHREFKDMYTHMTASMGAEPTLQESEDALQQAVELKEAISRCFIIPLPVDMASMSLSGKGKYCQIERHNGSVRELIESAQAIIESEALIESCKAKLQSLVVPDMMECGALVGRCQNMIPLLEALTKDQKNCKPLLEKLSTLSKVSEVEIEDQEYEAEMLQLKAKKRTLTAKERSTYETQATAIRERVKSLREAHAARARAEKALSPYVHLAAVAKALGVKRGPIPLVRRVRGQCGVRETERQRQREEEGVVGMMIKGGDVVATQKERERETRGVVSTSSDRDTTNPLCTEALTGALGASTHVYGTIECYPAAPLPEISPQQDRASRRKSLAKWEKEIREREMWLSENS
ncbi:XPG/Rad2 endonuclease [Kipferlia bialata]|uniref:XPG/Rad2 endonuclease n=1 Tax=Kipferlia bialata TaxID=797122 RepID=A0A9K3CUC3_9EUKA|nr:XPG/Rad2 endonuclease [Kipferlia bialata]|eukprot:g4324.t1